MLKQISATGIGPLRDSFDGSLIGITAIGCEDDSCIGGELLRSVDKPVLFYKLKGDIVYKNGKYLIPVETEP
ncbi:MAG: hypothetical protein KAU24_01305 [Candidatus Aenigmarchaeota archaeon]|nr:hypothetical protein [Candidatus Aenigmarchaeota archaeon]